jgi:aldehyde dehydrogenase (NAD+)
MIESLEFYINGEWVDPIEPSVMDVVNPATEVVIGRVSLGSPADVDRAVKAARSAFESYSRSSRDERMALLGRVMACYQERLGDLATTISSEMGAPMWLATAAQAPSGLMHLGAVMKVLKDYPFEETRGSTRIIKEAAGVCGFITPWNWPANQIMCKVAPALAAGCTMVLKPSEMTPLSAKIIAEVLHNAGVPAGVFNLVHGDGPTVGAAICEHPDIDVVSFTGSTRAGVLVARAAADSVKRVTQELGGKSANIILPDADLKKSVTAGVKSCFTNSGQSCDAPTRMFVHDSQYDEAVEIAKAAASSVLPGNPASSEKVLGPVASKLQYERVQALIHKGLDEGAELVCGGPGKPAGCDVGYFVKPTVFGSVTNDMTVAREEIFGPVLVILRYETEEQAIALANDTEYGLSGYVQSGDVDRALAVAARLRTGQVHINGAGFDAGAPFGGYKKSGNGREWGAEGFEEFLEIKAVLGAS